MCSTPSSPGLRAIQTMECLNKEMVFKVPKVPSKKHRKLKVLDEETYIEEMGKIIERDFFPDLEKLQAQNDYLDAVEQNDREKMHEISAKYSGARRPTDRPVSPATFETPADIHAARRDITDVPASEFGTPKSTNTTSDSTKTEKNISLDQYLASHTSEDNNSFSEIMEETEKRHMVKYAYLYNQESENNPQLALPSIEEQAAIKDRPFNIDTWQYKNKNYIMYVPDGVEPTKQELISMSKKCKEVVHSNTRLQINPFDEQQSKDTISELAKSQAKILDGRIGVDGKELTQTDTPQIRGFSLVRTPSPCPGIAESPLMTWGQIEGTPFKLDGSDTPLARSQGPSFKIAEPPKREKLAMALAEKAGERHRDRKLKAIEAARRQLKTPSPSPSSLRRLESMSPAARRLATAKLKDLGLRASYSPSPLSRRSTPATPIVHRPSTPKTPKIIHANKTLTDNLLQINVSKRKKASDFF